MISIIVAVAQNGVIGNNNQMPWHISEDFRYFKRVTTGHPILMGRKTYDSIGRPLPQRTNVVISRNKELAIEGVTVVGSLKEATSMFDLESEIFVIGGSQVYNEAIGIADRLYITEVDAPFEGDTHFPDWNRNDWKEIFRETHEAGEKFPHPFSFVVYERV